MFGGGGSGFFLQRITQLALGDGQFVGDEFNAGDHQALPRPQHKTRQKGESAWFCTALLPRKGRSRSGRLKAGRGNFKAQRRIRVVAVSAISCDGVAVIVTALFGNMERHFVDPYRSGARWFAGICSKRIRGGADLKAEDLLGIVMGIIMSGICLSLARLTNPNPTVTGAHNFFQRTVFKFNNVSTHLFSI